MTTDNKTEDLQRRDILHKEMNKISEEIYDILLESITNKFKDFDTNITIGSITVAAMNSVLAWFIIVSEHINSDTKEIIIQNITKQLNETLSIINPKEE